MQRKLKELAEWQATNALTPEGSAKLPRRKAESVSKDGMNLESERRASIEAFMATILEETGQKITRKQIWMVGGYKDATEFERFQRAGPRCTASAVRNFQRVLKMKPDRFMESLIKITGK